MRLNDSICSDSVVIYVPSNRSSLFSVVWKSLKIIQQGKTKLGRTSNCEGEVLDRDLRIAFLLECREELTGLRERLFAIIDHCNFQTKVCSS